MKSTRVAVCPRQSCWILAPREASVPPGRELAPGRSPPESGRHRRGGPGLFPLALLAGLLLTGPVFVQEKDRSPPPAPAAGAKQAAAPAAVPPKCEELYTRVKTFFGAFPKDVAGLSSKEADNLTLETEKVVNVCGAFLAECDAHARAGEVYYISGRLLYVLSARRRAEWINECREKPQSLECVNQRKLAYMKEIVVLARKATEKLSPEDPYLPRSFELAGQAAAEAELYSEAEQFYKTFLERYPKDDLADNVALALGRVYLDSDRYDDSIRQIQKCKETYPGSEQFPFFHELLWKALHSKGDLAGMLKLVDEIDRVVPEKMKEAALAKPTRDALDRLLDFNGFRRGYTLFAQGDLHGARKAFADHMDRIDKKAADLQKLGREIKPEVKIYRDRSQTIHRVVDELGGLPAPIEIDLGNTWVTPRKLTLAESRGKVVAIVFRGTGDLRSSVFLGPFSQWVARQPNQELVAVHYRKSGVPISQLEDELRDELARIQYEGAAGLDPDEANKPIFRRFLANVGSATLVILNKRGEVVWYMQDPRDVDVDFAKSIMTRLSEE